MKTQFPILPVSSKIVGISPAGTKETLIRIDRVEEHVPDGSYKDFVRVLIHNPKENIMDTFYFNTEDYKLSFNFIQSTEKTMELLTYYMMAIQDKYDLNGFVVEASKKFKADFGYKDVLMV